MMLGQNGNDDLVAVDNDAPPSPADSDEDYESARREFLPSDEDLDSDEDRQGMHGQNGDDDLAAVDNDALPSPADSDEDLDNDEDYESARREFLPSDEDLDSDEDHQVMHGQNGDDDLAVVVNDAPPFPAGSDEDLDNDEDHQGMYGQNGGNGEHLPSDEDPDNDEDHQGMHGQNGGNVVIDEDHDQVLQVSPYPNFGYCTVDPSNHRLFNLSEPCRRGEVPELWEHLHSLGKAPRNCFLRIYTTRVKLIRLAVVGGRDTPYHNFIYLFDIFLPAEYPSKMPIVEFWKTEVSMHPALEQSGSRVTIDLSNADESTPLILQVVVFISGLFCDVNPLIKRKGASEGSLSWAGESQRYNRSIFVNSCRNAVSLLYDPPRGFERFVAWHFRVNASSIMTKCDELGTAGGILYCRMLYAFDMIGANVDRWVQKLDGDEQAQILADDTVGNDRKRNKFFRGLLEFLIN